MNKAYCHDFERHAYRLKHGELHNLCFYPQRYIAAQRFHRQKINVQANLQANDEQRLPTTREQYL